VETIFKNRYEAGKKLAEKLSTFKNKSDVLVLALPRGGVPVAFEVAQYLNAPLDIFIVRKLGAPGYEELAMGAIASGGVRVLNGQVISALCVTPDTIEQVASRESEELHRRESVFRRGRPALSLTGKQIILVDDGLATGASMKAAATAVKKMNPSRIIVAVPVASRDILYEFESLVDDVVCSLTPADFTSVGSWYENFAQTSDEEVQYLLSESVRSSDYHLK
jgi:predicted phosphoribosyltransferase